ncbi:MAG: hypothetical protein ACE37H_02910 [Phycisphaeraceae bacterium]
MTNLKTIFFFALIVSAVAGGYVLGQNEQENEEIAEINKPFTPSRLEWLVLELNASHGFDDLDGKRGFKISYVATKDKKAVTVFVQYWPDSDRKMIQGYVDKTIKNKIITVAASHGWQGWIEIETLYHEL